MKISVPTSWDDVTVAQYQALSQMNIEDYKNDLSYTVAVLQVLCNLDSMVQLPMSAITELAPHIDFLKDEPTKIKHEQVFIDGVIYEWLPSFNAMTVGEAISIELPIDLEELTFTLSYDVVLAVMLREEGKKFDANLFKENRVKFSELPITEVLGMLLFFLNGGQTSTAHTKTYLIHPIAKRTTRKRRKLLRRLYDKIKKIILNGFR